MSIKFQANSLAMLQNWIKLHEHIFTNKLISLEGELGAGKTAFVQTFAKVKNIQDYVTSPTFNIMKIYGDLVHLDVYNLKSDLMYFQDYFIDKTTFIEWGSKVKQQINFDWIIYITKSNDNFFYEVCSSWK